MSLIKDVLNELKQLDVSEKTIKKFGFTVGSVFVFISAFLFWINDWQIARIFFLLSGSLLILGSVIRAKSEEMKIVYQVWMGIAFFLGWIMSRVILLILFYFILAPIGVLAKLFGKRFLDLEFKSNKDSYWITKEKKSTDFEKMF